ncbi:uncharacterized protein LOC144177738 [Haemaphysalis longicornis]
MYPVIRDGKKMDSYKLNDVAKTSLGEEKDDVPYKEIAGLHRDGGPDGRKKIADYCVQDTLLPLKLMAFTYTITSALEINRISHVPMRYVYGRGQQIRVLTTVLVESVLQGGYLFPSFAYCPRALREVKSYKGATVVHPKIGFYVDPVITLDFESLYPSTMRTGNFCITSWVWPEDGDTFCTREAGFVTRDEHDDDSVTKARWARSLDRIAAKKVKSKADLAFLHLHKSYVEVWDYIRPNMARLEQGSPQGSKENHDYFVQTSVREGVMPCMLLKLIDARRQVKKQMATETDPTKKIVLNERQISIKVIANSVYGFCAVSPSSEYALLPCQPVSRSVTNMGRTLIGATIYHVLDYSNQHSLGLRIVYGDTDSVMILTTHGTTLAAAEELGDRLAKHITDKFPGVINLCYEKTYMPYLLEAKKRYVGGHYTNGTFNKLDYKGIEIVRRDCCRYVSEALRLMIHELMTTSSIKSACETVRRSVLGVREAPQESLVISKTFKKENPHLPHYQLVLRIKRRGDAIAPQIGDRVPYILCAVCTSDREDQKMCNLSDHVEDTVVALKRKIPIDYSYYTDAVVTSLSRYLKVPLFCNTLTRSEMEFAQSLTRPYLRQLGAKKFEDLEDAQVQQIAQLVILNDIAGGRSEGSSKQQRSLNQSFKATCKRAATVRESVLLKNSMRAFLQRAQKKRTNDEESAATQKKQKKL